MKSEGSSGGRSTLLNRIFLLSDNPLGTVLIRVDRVLDRTTTAVAECIGDIGELAYISQM